MHLSTMIALIVLPVLLVIGVVIWVLMEPDKSENFYVYEVILSHWPYATNLGLHIDHIKADGAHLPSGTVELYAQPDRNVADAYVWNEQEGLYYNHLPPVGERIMTIIVSKKISAFEIKFPRKKYCPGLLIKENGVEKLSEPANAGDGDAALTKGYLLEAT